MADWSSLGKLFMFIGGLMFLIGGFFLLGGRFFNIGRLPGDIFVQKGNVTFFFPVVSMIIISVVLTIVLNLFLRR